MPERARRQVIPGDGKCLSWALSGVDRAGRQAAAEEVHRALTEGDMARPPESGCSRRVMRNAGAHTWDQYLDKVRKGDIWGGACEVRRWAQSKGCRIAMYQEWGPQGVYRKMAEVREGKRTAAALLWSRRGGGHYELLGPPEEEEAEAVAGAEEEDGAESKDGEEKAMGVELAVAGPEKGEEQGGRTEEQPWQDVQQIQIQRRGERWWYQGQEGSERGYSTRQETTGRMGRCARSAGAGDGVCGGARGYGGKVSRKGHRQGGWTCGSPGGDRRCYGCSTGMMLGPSGGQRERSRCERAERCGWSQDGGEGTGWRRRDNGGGVGI